MKIIELHTQNFRTLENLSLDFSSYYSSICGKNDAGKSNVIKVLCAFFSVEDSSNIFDREAEISIKSDFTKWKDETETARKIIVTGKIEIDRDKDAGIFEFVKTYLSLVTEEQLLILVITVSYSEDGEDVVVEIGESKFTDLKAQEVLKKLRSSNTVLLHNSTGMTVPFRILRGLGGLTRNLSPEYDSLMESITSLVNERLQGFAELQQKEISELIGRLDSKYKVSLALPEFDPGYLPFNITLGDPDVNIPLDEWGSGTRNRTRILLTLFRAKQISNLATNANKITPIIVIEEPESFLHPSAQAEFGRVLQSLAEDFGVQVIVTSHSPYMLSQTKPDSNILLERVLTENKVRGTQQVDTESENWMEPFGLALGINNIEFEPWKELFFSDTKPILLVEGETDKDYLELLKDISHGEKRLKFEGEIFPYNGAGTLSNTVLLRFIKNRYKNLVVTYDLDVESQVEKHLITLGLVKGKDYVAVGLPEKGKKNIEGLIPNEIASEVYSKCPDLIAQISNGEKEERDEARKEMKRIQLAEFKRLAKPGEDYANFYALAEMLNKAFGL